MEDISVVELKTRLEAKENFKFLDVREQHEFDEDNLGAELIPLHTLPMRVGELNEWKDEEILIHCRSGARSGQAKLYLQSQGFSKVRNVLGGIIAYRELG